MKTILILLTLFLLSCTSHETYCAEGLMWHDGLHLYYSETTTPDIIEFHGEPHNYYVIEYSPCSSGICIESYQVGQVEAFSKHFILTNGCAK